MVTAEDHEKVVMERDSWESIAHERQAALDKLKADRSAETIRSAGRLMQLAWVLMLVMVVFAGVLIVSGAVRASARECPPCASPLLERP